MLLFGGIGIMAAILGFKLFDKCTPGNLAKEILERQNVAAAIVAGAVILGVCLIIAAAMLG
jgi:putative membrane protein